MVKFRTRVKNKPDDCLKNCSSHIFDGASANLLPFAYSLTEKNIKDFKERQPSKGNSSHCRKLPVCGGDERLCMPWTFLEVAWNKCLIDDDFHIFAHTHPSKTINLFIVLII
ncbi:unnamed protein product [Meloidogyne enterolobii]|uniref:Uncharacterized protein n=1 Tax=Meloidogyne enterolobii TaxID=390850 RepID=A0ACB1AU92_MELEN